VRILAEAAAAVERVGQNHDTPTGTLRLTASVDYGMAVVAPALAQFMRLHPQLQVDLVLDDQVSDLIAERFDLAIRIGWLRDSSLRAVQLATIRQRLVAAPAYLAEHGHPRRPAELAAHPWIAVSLLAAPLRWTFTSAAGARSTVRMRQAAQVNNANAARALVLSGAGLTVLPEHLVREDLEAGRLVALLGRHRLPEGGIYAVYPGRRPPAKVRAFIDHLRARLEA
jgi:DNA-binding transcriptional LysR family regulator